MTENACNKIQYNVMYRTVYYTVRTSASTDPSVNIRYIEDPTL